MKKLILIVSISVLILAFQGNAIATPITGYNANRPFVIGDAIGVSPNYTVQEMLDVLAFGVNAITDQSSTGVWTAISVPPFTASAQILSFEFAGSEAANDLQEFGLWTAYDTAGPINTIPVFLGAADPVTLATVAWDTATSGYITGGTGVNVGAFSGIAYNFFGFYYKYSTASVLYSYDDLNANSRVSALSYMEPSGGAWAIFFDGDTNLSPGDPGYDFNDLVVKVESIKPIPEPATMLLLGSGLIGIAAYARRRFHKK